MLSYCPVLPSSRPAFHNICTNQQVENDLSLYLEVSINSSFAKLLSRTEHSWAYTQRKVEAPITALYKPIWVYILYKLCSSGQLQNAMNNNQDGSIKNVE